MGQQITAHLSENVVTSRERIKI